MRWWQGTPAKAAQCTCAGARHCCVRAWAEGQRHIRAHSHAVPQEPRPIILEKLLSMPPPGLPPPLLAGRAASTCYHERAHAYAQGK